MKKLFVSLLFVFAILMSSNVLADVNVVYHFNANNVQALGYVCLDAGCNSVSSSQWYVSKSTTDGKLKISYPSKLKSNYGYAVYFASPGYVPMAYNVKAYGDGSLDYNVNFIKIANCHSTIDSFTITNTNYANEPLTINVDAALDAKTYSAFFETDNGVGYVPYQWKDEYYSADTSVKLTIKNSNGNNVYQDARYFTADNGNPLYMSSSRDVNFIWTPTAAGTYTASVQTDVIDDQCSSETPQQSSKNFNVNEERPTNECYTILNNLATDEPYPIVNDPLEIKYTKISNYANLNYELTSVPTSMEYKITDSSGNTVFSDSKTINANSDTSTPAEQLFSWTPPSSGWYTINVYGIASSSLCNGLKNTKEHISEQIYIKAQQTYSVNFEVADSKSGNPISGVSISIGGKQGYTDTNGQLLLQGFSPGQYPFTASKTGYETKTGTIPVTNYNIDYFFTMSKKNSAPIISGVPDITITKNTQKTLNMNDYIYDAESADSDLKLTASGNNNILVSIDATTHVATFIPTKDWTGSEKITFTVADPQVLSGSDDMTATVLSANTAPTIQYLPDIATFEDTPMYDVFYLGDFANDKETAFNNLVFTLSVTNSNKCSVSIGTDKKVDIVPQNNFYGTCTATITVSDGELTASDSFLVTVYSINDAPKITSSPITTATVNQLYNYDVATTDADGDVLTFSLTTKPSGMAIDSSTGLISWTPTQTGTYAVAVQVSDGQLSDTQSYSITVSQSTTINNPPAGTLSATPTSGTAPLAVTFTITGSDSDGTVDYYTLNYGDGTSSGNINVDSTSFTATLTHTYNNAGTYTATLTLYDNDGASSAASIIITVSVTCNNGVIYGKVMPSGGIVKIGAGSDTDCTDGGCYSSVDAFNYFYLQNVPAGTYTVTASKTGYAAQSKQVTVGCGQSVKTSDFNLMTSNNAPAGTLSASPTSGDAPLAVTFTITGSDSDGTVDYYTLNYGDGTSSGNINVDSTSFTATLTHTYNNAGTYTATLTLYDNDGASSAASIIITANTITPQVSLTVDITSPANGASYSTCGHTTITFIGTAKDSNGNDVNADFSWSSSIDGTFGTGNPYYYALLSEGTHTITLTATTPDGATGSDSISIYNSYTNCPPIPPPPANNPPTGTLSASPTSGTVPLAVTFTATGSDSDGTVSNYVLNYGDGTSTGTIAVGSSSFSATYSHTYTTAGIYTATLTLTDDDGATSSASAAITANAATPPTPVTPVTKRSKKLIRLPEYELLVSGMNPVNGDNLEAGDELKLNLQFYNSGDYNLENIRATAVIDELATRKQTGPFDLKKNNQINRDIVLEIPEFAEPGTYYLRLSVYNDKIRRTIYRQIKI